MRKKEKINKVYILHSGDYSSRHVVGVFSNRKKAEEFSTRFVRTDIEEWNIDDADTKVPEGHEVFYVQMDISTGELFEVYEGQPDRYEEVYRFPEIDVFSSLFRIWCFARDDEHAIKIASERLAKWKIENLGWDIDLGEAVKKDLFKRVDYVYPELSKELTEDYIYAAYDILNRIIHLEINDVPCRDISDYYDEKLDGFVKQYEANR